MNDSKPYLEIAARFYDCRVDDLNPDLILFLIRLSGGIKRAYANNYDRDGADLRSSQVISLACMTWEGLNPDKAVCP